MQRIKAKFVILLVLSSTILPAIPIQTATASAPTLDGFCHATKATGSTVSCTLTTTSTNDIIVVDAIASNGGSCTGGHHIGPLSVSGLSLTWALRAATSDAFCSYHHIFWANAPSVVSGSITLTLNGTVDLWDSIVAFGVNGADTTTPWDPNPSLPRYTKGVASSVMISNSFSTSAANDMLLEFCMFPGGDSGTVLNPGTIPITYTLIDKFTTAGGSNSGYVLNGYAQVSTTYSGTTNRCTKQSGPTGRFVMVSDALQEGTTLVITPCNWFQLQCWWYPSLMLVLFISGPIGVATASKSSAKAILYITLVSLAFGSGIEVMMGVMTVAMPLILTITAALYAWRVL